MSWPTTRWALMANSVSATRSPTDCEYSPLSFSIQYTYRNKRYIIFLPYSTGIKRVLEGEIKKAASKAEEGKLIVKYTIPLTPETKYSVLETDYDSYAVLWSCSGIGPFHTQNAWVMTRERLAPGTVLQKVKPFHRSSHYYIQSKTLIEYIYIYVYIHRPMLFWISTRSRKRSS